jgi:hypothetical protein
MNIYMSEIPMPDRFGKRFDDSPFLLWLVALKWGAVCAICFTLGYCANITSVESVQQGISAFAGGMVGCIMLISGGGKFVFDILKQASEAQIAELRGELETERNARQNENALFAVKIAELERRNSALQDALAGRP